MKKAVCHLFTVLAVVLPAYAVNAQVATSFDYEGAVLKSKIAGVEEYVKPDGSRILKYPDSEKALLKDGTVIERRGGSREITSPDGTKLFIDADGSRRYVYTDGRERVFSMKGKTPYGEEIKGIERKIGSNGFLTIEYSAPLSDDQMDGAVKLFFDELAAACNTAPPGKKPADTAPMRIVISNCRFCRTGYCSSKKNSEIEVITYRGIDSDKKLSIPYNGILKKENRQKFIAQIVSMYFDR